MQKRSERHLISRPDISDVFKYRKHVDRCIKENISLIVSNLEALKRLKIGINHEEQHIELLITDLKYNFYKTPLQPAFVSGSKVIRPRRQDRLVGIE